MPGLLYLAMSRTRRPRERWRATPGFPLYEVSDLGRVRTYKGQNQYSQKRTKPKLMRQRIGSEGYKRVTLQNKSGDKQVVSVHLLVARAFLGRAGGRVVRHRDGKPSNPALTNLEYGTQGENSADKLRHGTDARGSKNASALLNEREVQEILRLKGQKTQGDIADQFGISRQAVSDIHRGVTWTYE